MPISTEQLNTIENYDDEKRLSYLLQQVVSNKEIWLLTDEHGCMMLNTDDEDCVPVWPNKEFAQGWATGEWQACQPQEISLAKWYSRWSVGLADDDLALVVFPNQDNKGLILFPEEFEQLLLKETKKQNRK
ncbi:MULTISPECIES: DUF2750 domain-containing protein [Colwellia]|uniref:DUF2750 domain-containing protein n=1 Tax=Colwellia marinimaniae TaxID=1513592 RepID=A0ABQ0MWV1_9GAMM|nr:MULTISPECIES: DUF2750 domain-containing protein [Colwellia]GAW96858.1 hypothetical protein MTCD1_02481 [Colwellia marinimaniae]